MFSLKSTILFTLISTAFAAPLDSSSVTRSVTFSQLPTAVPSVVSSFLHQFPSGSGSASFPIHSGHPSAVAFVHPSGSGVPSGHPSGVHSHPIPSGSFSGSAFPLASHVPHHFPHHKPASGSFGASFSGVKPSGSGVHSHVPHSGTPVPSSAPIARPSESSVVEPSASVPTTLSVAPSFSFTVASASASAFASAA